MKIVFYTTRSELFHGDFSHWEYFPTRADQWDDLAEKYPQHEFIFVAKIPAMYMLDLDGEQVSAFPKKVKYVFYENEECTAVADLVAAQNPDAAIAIPVAGIHFDWNFLRDAMVAEELQKRGIRAIAQTVYTSMACYDKWRSNIFLRANGFGIAKGIYVHNEMFWVEKQKGCNLHSNVYKEYVLYRLKELEYPVIIKSTTGAGSLGITIASTFEEARDVLCSENNTSDVIVEEKLSGEQFGTEIHGVKGHYHVLPPYALSTNKEGITDPYSSVKFGPVTDEKYHVKQLQESLLRLAEENNFAGTTQVDLVFHNGAWNIIEINPRWSGMTTTTAASESRNPLEIYVDCVDHSPVSYSDWSNLKDVVNFKMKNVDSETLKKIAAFPGIRFIGQTISDVPGRPRIDFCEVVFGGFDTRKELVDGFLKLKETFPDAVADTVVSTFMELIKKY